MPPRKKASRAASPKLSRRPARSAPAGVDPTGWGKTIIWILIGIVAVVFAVESLNLFHGEVVKDFQVRYLSTIGSQSKCGVINAWGVGPVGKDKIMVVDQEHDRILVFDRQGNCLKSWGKLGLGSKEYHEPSGLTSDDQGNGYVIDTWGNAIKGYDENGKEILNVSLTNGNFYGPRGIGFDGKNFAIADTGSQNLKIVGRDGRVQTVWGGLGKEPGQFQGLLDVVCDEKGDYFVADSDNDRVQWLDQDGKVVKIFKCKAPVPAVALDKEGRLYISTATGTGSSCVKAYSLKDGYLGDLKDDKGRLVSGGRGLAVTPDDVLLIAGGDSVGLYQLPSVAP